ncbi:MFS transporter [Embleya scabrispora]|uniref:MFS transporter n=1 Tax=Embleya scabrispora TaxID=159449 RepID=UPI0003609909|nr:MFS transporter [Embleya scabrispora]MYS79976.1 MFS transporter [Streptomyces sp. SID5474]
MTSPTAKAGRKEWIALTVLLLPLLLVSMDMGVLYFALPFISEDLEPTAPQQLWMMDVYGFLLAGLLITMGALGDRIGRRRLLLIGAAAFGATSVAASFANSAEMLIATRALLGVAGATLMPSTLALIRNMFHDPAQRRTAIGVWTAALTAGATLGPVAGGLLLDHFWWGSAFLLNVPAMVLLLAVGPFLLPEFKDPAAGRLDLISAGLSLVAVLTVIYGIKEIAAEGVAPLHVISIAVGLVVGFLFVRRQRTIANPLIDLELFRNRAYSASIAVNVIASIALLGSALFNTQYMQLVLGMRPLEAALWSLTVMPVIMVALTVSGILAKRVRPGFLIGAGLLLSVAGFLVMSSARPGSPLVLVLAGAGLVAAGVLIATTLTAEMVLTAAPPERAGAAGATSETGSELGGALGIAILGSIADAVYGRDMRDATLDGVPTDAANAANDTLAAASATAERLSGRAGDQLLDTARHAFTHGMQYATLGGAVLLTLAAVVATVVLRGVPIAADAETRAETEGEAAAEPETDARVRAQAAGLAVPVEVEPVPTR